MKRSVLFLALLLSVVSASAEPKDYGTITTRAGKAFYECRVMHVYPDGVSFTHRNGAAKIAFSDLPENLRTEFRYDPKVEAEYQKEQAALRKAEQERQKQQEIVMQERLMEARMAEASYLAAASKIAATPSTTAGAQTPSWVGAPIIGPAVGGRGYSGGYGYGGGYYSGINYGYPYGSYYGSYPYYGGYSYGSYPYGGYYGGGYSPTIFGSWNVGHGIHIGIGGGGGFGFGGHHHR